MRHMEGPSKKTKSKKTKAASKTQPEPAIQARYEGNDDLAYEPPPGAVLLDFAEDDGEFEWAHLKEDDDVELWLVRVPESLKSKHLESVRIAAPSETSGSSSSRQLGNINRKQQMYDIMEVVDGEDQGELGCEELKGLTCLLPRAKKGGKLYLASKRVAHRLVITPSDPTPQSPEDPSSPTVTRQNPPRFSYPNEVLTHRYVPFGAATPIIPDTSAMEIDEGEGESNQPLVEIANAAVTTAAGLPSSEEMKKHKKGSDMVKKDIKKRKIDVSGESPKKKGKKLKTGVEAD